MVKGRIFWGLVILLVGVLLLMDNLGYFPGINIWGVIWPLFLIVLGGWILWNYFTRRLTKAEHIALPVNGAKRATIRFQHGAGRIEISSGTGQETLIEGDFMGGLVLNNHINNEDADIWLKLPESIFPLDWSPGQSLDWSVKLNREIPLALNLETGASESTLDLQDLVITELKLKSGASSTSLTLPANAGMTKVDIDSGVSSINVLVPQGVAARIRSRGGLSNVSVSDRFPRTGSVYQSLDFDASENRVEIDIEMGVGSVIIR